MFDGSAGRGFLSRVSAVHAGPVRFSQSGLRATSGKTGNERRCRSAFSYFDFDFDELFLGVLAFESL